MECCVGLAVAAAVEAMAVGPDRGGGYGIHAAQKGEGSLCAEMLGVAAGAASSHEQGRRRRDTASRRPSTPCGRGGRDVLTPPIKVT